MKTSILVMASLIPFAASAHAGNDGGAHDAAALVLLAVMVVNAVRLVRRAAKRRERHE